MMTEAEKIAKKNFRKELFVSNAEKVKAANESIESSETKYQQKKQERKEEWLRYKQGIAYCHEHRKKIFVIPSINMKTNFAFMRIAEGLFRMVSVTRHSKDRYCYRALKSALGLKLMNSEGIVLRIESPTDSAFVKFLTTV